VYGLFDDDLLMRVLISAPSLNEDENVSGVSEAVKNILKIEQVDFVHFQIGSPDGHDHLIGKIIRNLSALILLLRTLLFCKIDIYHSNTGLNPNAIVRDYIFTAIASLLGKQVVLHLHGGEYITKKSERWGWMIRSMLNRADIILTLGEQERRFVCQYYGVIPARIIVLRNCVDIGLSNNDTVANNLNTITLLFLGRLSQEKGVLEIIEAFEKLESYTNFNFVVCGEGPLKTTICSRLKERLGERFEYKGVVKGFEKERVLQDAHYLLLPSHYEGLPMALLEAMASATVPIVTDVSASINELLDTNVGIYVQANNSTSLQLALKRVLTKEINWRDRALKAQQIVATKYDCCNMRIKLRAIYNDLLIKA